MKQPNKSGKPPAEAVVGRPLTKENMDQPNQRRTPSRINWSSGLDRVREVAKKDKKIQFTALLHHVTVDLLRDSFYALKRQAAPGVDGVMWQEYGSELEVHLIDLHGRIHRGAYRAQPSLRTWIPKADGRQRPLGIAALEDKVVEHAVGKVLNQIWEEDFLGFSYGFRPGRSQHDALDALWVGIMRKKVNWILELDIRSFFDKVRHDWMVKFVEHRVGDKRIVRLIQKWLKAGVMEEGRWFETEEGTPQGSVISPILGNLYLHYCAPGQTGCFQRVKFPPRQEVEPPYRESSLGSEEVTNRTKRRQSDARAVTKVKRLSLVKYTSAGRQHSNGWQAPVGAPQMARWPETAAGSGSTARAEMEASRDLGDPLWSWSNQKLDRVCPTIWIIPEKGRRHSAKSDSLIVLRARESRVQGEAAKQMKTDFRETSLALTEAGI
jgi:retron-type reverse transcriptase